MLINGPSNHHTKFEIFPVYYGFYKKIFKLRGFSIDFVLWLEWSTNRHINLWENHLFSGFLLKLAVDSEKPQTWYIYIYSGTSE